MNIQFLALKGVFLMALLCTAGPFLKAQQVPVKFSVDMSYQVNQGKFTPGTDQVFLKGSFNNWSDQNQMAREGSTTVYSVTMQFNKNASCEYKYFINTPGADNGGWEKGLVFGDYGNRRLWAFENAVTLPVVFYNNADMAMNLATEHFDFWCTAQDLNSLNEFSTKLEGSYSRIVTALETSVTSKIEIYFFKDIPSFHCATGYPESPDWASGSAYGKALIVLASPNNAGPAGYYGQLDVIVHEFAHCVVAWKMTGAMTNWLNEGIATYMGGQSVDRAGIQYEFNRLGYLPTLSDLENSFIEMGGYGFSFTIADFIVKTKGMSKLAQFTESMSYSVLGFADRAAFQTAWHNYLQLNYINTPPPAITIGTISKTENNWVINYTPHPEKDDINNLITYSFTITSTGFSKTFTDNSHTGAFAIAASEFKAHTTYRVDGKSYVGSTSTDATNQGSFTTANTPPTPFSFTSPAYGTTISYNSSHKLRIEWSPAQYTDADGDYITDRITIEGNGLNKVVDVGGVNGFLLVDSSDFQPNRTYTLKGERRDGIETAVAGTIVFMTPRSSGITSFDKNFRLAVFPVPASDQVTFQADFTQPLTLNLQVFSITGTEMFAEKLNVQGSFTHSIDIGNFPQGVYYIRFITLNGNGLSQTATRKIIRE